MKLFDEINYVTEILKKGVFAAIFILFSCSKETQSERLLDPIVGEWEVTLYNYEEVGDRSIEYTFEGTLAFFEDGTALQSGTLIFGVVSESVNQAFTWENRKSLPDYSATTQSYLIDNAINFVVFSEDFDYAQVTDEEGDTIEVFRK